MKSLTRLFKSIDPRHHASSLAAIVVVNLVLVARHVILRSVTTMTLILWLTAIIAMIILLRPHSQTQRIKPTNTHFPLWQIIFLILTTTITLAWFGTKPYHSHFDEQLTAYFSYTLPPISTLDWFGVYPKASDWVSQFPILYYIL